MVVLGPEKDCLEVLGQAQQMLRAKHSIVRTTIQVEHYDEPTMSLCQDCRRPGN